MKKTWYGELTRSLAFALNYWSVRWIKQGWQNTDNLWIWVMKTWRFFMVFSVHFCMCKSFRNSHYKLGFSRWGGGETVLSQEERGLFFFFFPSLCLCGVWVGVWRKRGGSLAWEERCVCSALLAGPFVPSSSAHPWLMEGSSLVLAGKSGEMAFGAGASTAGTGRWASYRRRADGLWSAYFPPGTYWIGRQKFLQICVH